MAVDASGNVYVADMVNDRIQKFTSEGTFLAKWGSQGNGDGQFRIPSGVAVDASGNVYVADSDNDRIQVFASGEASPTPTPIPGVTSWGLGALVLLLAATALWTQHRRSITSTQVLSR